MDKDEFTNRELLVDVGDGHKLWVMDWGNKDAKTPIISLHGGPGSQAKEKHKIVFDPKVHRVIFFDQRGCGKSTPFGSRRGNNTEELAKDISKIAKHLKISKFYLIGGSWGSTLALYYAINYPEMLAGLVISGVWSGSKNEIFGMHDIAKIFYPDLWEWVLLDTPAEYRDDPMIYHLDKALNGTSPEQKKSSYVVGCLEGGMMKLDDRGTPDIYDEYDPTCMQMELSYVATNCFMPENYILDNVNRIRVPVYIVQGRFDMVCPPDFAYKISKLIPDCKLYMAISNHAGEHEVTSLLRVIIDSLE
jgi:proline iminopeptidase